jgi:hypothetical protein
VFGTTFACEATAACVSCTFLTLRVCLCVCVFLEPPTRSATKTIATAKSTARISGSKRRTTPKLRCSRLVDRTHPLTYTHSPSHTHAHSRTRKRTPVHPYTHTDTYTCPYTVTYLHTHTHIAIPIRIHLRAPTHLSRTFFVLLPHELTIMLWFHRPENVVGVFVRSRTFLHMNSSSSTLER